MQAPAYEFTGELWRYPGKDGWYFLTVPGVLADEIRDRARGDHRPFGSLRVRATLGSTAWGTSLFADSSSSSYLLPVKAEVRSREGIGDGDVATVTIELAI